MRNPWCLAHPMPTQRLQCSPALRPSVELLGLAGQAPVPKTHLLGDQATGGRTSLPWSHPRDAARAGCSPMMGTLTARHLAVHLLATARSVRPTPRAEFEYRGADLARTGSWRDEPFLPLHVMIPAERSQIDVRL